MAVGSDAPALLEGDRIWTKAELDRDIEARIEALRSDGLRPGDRIGLTAEASAVAVIDFLTCLRSGVTVVPLGPRLTAPEREAIRSAAGVRPPELASDRQLDPNPPAVIVPTSGTIARPKLVRLTLGQLEASAAAWTAVLPPATGWLLSLGLAHVSGIGIVVRATRAGVPIVIAGDGQGLADTFARARAHGIAISHVSMVAAQIARLLESGVEPPEELRVVILGGGPIGESLLRAASGAGWPVLPSYGMTETASGVVAAGRPMPGVELRIDAPTGSAPSDAGSAPGDAGSVPDRDGTGEILVRGPMVFSGYEGDAALTAATLDADGWLHTGDLGSLDAEGRLRVVGRRDELMISGGENVAPAEVEATLASHPHVADVAVTGVPDERWGQVPMALVAFRSPAAGAPAGARPNAEELRAFARERLASYKVPSRFLEVDRVPRTANGKLVRRLLPALVAAAGQRSTARDVRVFETSDGQPIVYRDSPGPAAEPGRPPAPIVVLVHGTLLTGAQFAKLAYALQPTCRVLSIDRRGSGASKMARPAHVPIARHVDDLVAVLDDAGVERAVVFGHSFGANLSLELAARHPERVAAVVVYEPPYLALADAPTAARFAPLPGAVLAAYERGGAAAAAELFLRRVVGDAYWEGITEAQRDFSRAEGGGAVADTGMAGLEPDGLSGITCPVTIATGGATDPFYAPLADAVAARIPGARRATLPGLNHGSPIADPGPFAELILGALD